MHRGISCALLCMSVLEMILPGEGGDGQQAGGGQRGGTRIPGSAMESTRNLVGGGAFQDIMHGMLAQSNRMVLPQLPAGSYCKTTRLLLRLRGGRSKRSGVRVRKALEDSKGKSAAAARFPVQKWEVKKAEPAPEDRGGYAGGEGQGGRLGFVRDHKKPKKLSNRQLANMARERHRAGMSAMFKDVDPTRNPALELMEGGTDAYLKTPLYGVPSLEEVAKNSSFTEMMREADAWDQAKTVRSKEEMLACVQNGTYFKLPKKIMNALLDQMEEGAVSRTFPDGFSRLGEQMIMYISVGNMTGVHDMLDGGANPSYRNVYRETPLHLAALYGRVEAVKLLLERGANVSAANFANYTAMDYSHWSGFNITIPEKYESTFFPAPCPDKEARSKIRKMLAGAGGECGKGIGWQKLEALEASGMLDRFPEACERMPFDLLKLFVDIGIVDYRSVSHRFPSSIHGGVSPWIAVAKEMGVEITETPAFTPVRAPDESAEGERGRRAVKEGSVEDMLSKLRAAPQADSDEDPDIPSSQMPPDSSSGGGEDVRLEDIFG